MAERSRASSPGSKSIDAPATLSVVDLKSQLMSSMKKNGVLGNLKAQLRTQFLSELKSLAKEGGRGRSTSIGTAAKKRLTKRGV